MTADTKSVIEEAIRDHFDRPETIESAKERYVDTGNGYDINDFERDVERILDRDPKIRAYYRIIEDDPAGPIGTFHRCQREHMLAVVLDGFDELEE